MMSKSRFFRTLQLSAIFGLSLLSFSLVSQHIGIALDSINSGDGLRVQYAEDNGIRVLSTGGDGVYVGRTERDGFSVFNARRNGIYVANAVGNGIHVINAEGWSLNIEGDKSQRGSPSAHIAQIFNRADEGNADVLALKVGQSNPGSVSKFITFFDGDDDVLGRIEGNGSGNVSFISGGADFAEFIPIHPTEEEFSPGDVVGIVDGKVMFNTAETNRAMVITDRPIVVGNAKENENEHQMVGFIGQVPVRVSGKVNAGDWIVASGMNDGTGIAIAPGAITLDHKIVGQAWESNVDVAVKRVNTAIGLDQSQAKDVIIKKLEHEMKAQQEAIQDLQIENKGQQLKNQDLQTQINELKKAIVEIKN